MTKEQADKQANDLIKIIRDSGIKKVKVREMNIIDLVKFVDTCESRLNYLPTFSKNWKSNYFVLYLVKKKITNE